MRRKNRKYKSTYEQRMKWKSRYKARCIIPDLDTLHCEECGRSGKEYQLNRHHTNGDRDDNRRANLMVLCDGCHYIIHHP